MDDDMISPATVADLIDELGKYPPGQAITADADGRLRVDGVPVLHGSELLN